jgi:hypothetical protein
MFIIKNLRYYDDAFQMSTSRWSKRKAFGLHKELKAAANFQKESGFNSSLIKLFLIINRMPYLASTDSKYKKSRPFGQLTLWSYHYH